MIELNKIFENCCNRQLEELASIPRGTNTYTVNSNPNLGIDRDYTFHNIPLKFESWDDLRRYSTNPTRVQYDDTKGNQGLPVSNYLSTDVGGNPPLNNAGNIMGTSTFYWKLFENPKKMEVIIRAIGKKIDNNENHPILKMLDDVRFFTGDYNKISLNEFWANNPRLRNVRLPLFLNLIKSLSPNWRSDVPRDPNRLSPYSAEFRPDEPATDDMFYTKFDLDGNPPIDLNQRGIYLWVFNGTQVKYVGIAGKNNNLSGRFGKYKRIQMDACGTLGPNCRINNAIMQAQMQLKKGKNPNNYIKWFVLPLGNEISNKDLEDLEQKFISYFGTKADMDPILNSQNYSSIEAFDKIKQRGSLYPDTPNRQTKQGFRGKLNRK